MLPKPGADVRGYNMFTYCMNNPVNMSDESGHWPQWIKNVVKTVAKIVTVAQAIVNIPTTVTKIAITSTIAVVSGKATVRDVWNDAKNYNFFNTDEKKVLDSKVFSSYKGTPVIRHDISSITSFSISNTIVLNSNENSIDAVKHEWGHTVQESLMGTPKYLTRIAIPSIVSNIFVSSSKTAYSLPWERGAEFFGGANSSTYYEGSGTLAGLYFLMP